MSEKIKAEEYMKWGKTMTKQAKAIVVDKKISDEDLERLKNTPFVSIKNEAIEKCGKTNRECGYLNFFNDVDNLMKEHNIKGVRNLEKALEDYEYLKTELLGQSQELNAKTKALEVIKECFVLNGFDELIPNSKWFDDEEKQDLLRGVLM